MSIPCCHIFIIPWLLCYPQRLSHPPCAFLQVNEPIIVACRIRCLSTVSAHHRRMCACTNVLLLSSLSFERPFTSSAKSGLRTILVQTSACQSHKGIMGLKFTSVIRKYQKGGGPDLWGSLWPWALLIVAPLPPSYNIHLWVVVFSDAFCPASCALESPICLVVWLCRKVTEVLETSFWLS